MGRPHSVRGFSLDHKCRPFEPGPSCERSSTPASARVDALIRPVPFEPRTLHRRGDAPERTTSAFAVCRFAETLGFRREEPSTQCEPSLLLVVQGDSGGRLASAPLLMPHRKRRWRGNRA